MRTLLLTTARVLEAPTCSAPPFTPSYVGYSIIKSVVYAFIISSVASYYGYCVKGGALQVGASSTRAVVNSSVLILFWDLLLTNILLT